MSESDCEGEGINDEEMDRGFRPRACGRLSATATLESPPDTDGAAFGAGYGRDASGLRSEFSTPTQLSPVMLSVTPARGERIGEGSRFEIIDKLGQGGMGHVFRATDSHLDRPVAIKFILQSHGLPMEQLVTQVKREAKTTARLNHENIVAIFDIDAYQGMPFLVMELLDGQSLDVMTQRTLLAPLRATRIMVQVSRGLMHAHEHGVVHRDLKPSNVFILRDGRAKILDFGISRLELPMYLPSDMAPNNNGFGTPAFMAPEQWRSGPQDARADIWAAGVMFYQLLTGQLPYSVAELLQFKSSVRVRSVAPSVRTLVPSLPEEIQRVVATALNEEPEGRYQAASELWDALREIERLLAGGAGDSDAASGSSQLERRPMTLLACSLDGQETLELDDILDADERFYRTSAEAVKRWDGTIGTPVGGRFFCCFGHPAVTETDAQRAVHAALDIAQAMRSHNSSADGPHFRIGIHSGLVALPNLPGISAGIPAMQGNVPNVATDLCDGAPPSRVLMSHATLDLTRGLFRTERWVEAEAWKRRLQEPVYELIAKLESASRFEQTFATFTTPLVGRAAELQLIIQLWEEASDGRGRMLAVSGDAGIGKSRLVQTLKERVLDEQNEPFTCQCHPHHRNSALYPVMELMLRSIRIRSEDAPKAKLEKLEHRLKELGFSLPEAVPLFASFLSIPLDERYSPIDLAPEQQKLKTLEGLVSMLLRLALTRPTLFIMEDMHWADHSTIEFLSALIDRIPSSRLLVVLTGRPEFRPPWSARPHLHQLKLERLSSEHTASMVSSVARGRELSAEVTRQLVVTTDGVPLFVEELTRMALESWRSPDGGWTHSRLSIPRTLQQLLLARLDRLRGLGKDVAQVASVIGRDFSYGLIRRVATLDDLSLQQGLELLVAAGLLHQQGKSPATKYMFKHALIQQAAYESLVKTERQRHHRRTAEALSEVVPDAAEFEPELLAYHHGEAGNSSEAILFWERAGERATRRSALVEAIAHYGKALETLRTLPAGPERDRREVSLLLALGSSLMSVHGYAAPEVERTYARARELARAAGKQGELFPAMQGLWQFYYVRGMLPTARGLGEQLLEIAQEAGNSSYLLLAHRCVASSAFLQGDFECCRVHTLAGLSIYEPNQHGSLVLRTGHDPGVAHGVYRAWTLWMLGYADQSLHEVDAMVQLAKSLAHPLTIAYAQCFAALLRNKCGRHREAHALAEDALAITVENRFALWTAWAKMQQGLALAGVGDLGGAITSVREGLDGWRSTGARVGFTFFPVTLAEVCLKAGRLDECIELLDDAVPIVQNNDEHFYEAELWRLKGEWLAATHTTNSDADTHFQRAIEIARAQRAKSWELRAAVSRGRWLAQRGEAAEALAGIHEVYQWFTEGFETADLISARAESTQIERVTTNRA